MKPSSVKSRPPQTRTINVCGRVPAALVAQFDFYLGRDLAPGGDLAVKPCLCLVQRLVRLDARQLLMEGVEQSRGSGSLSDGVEQCREHRPRRVCRREHA